MSMSATHKSFVRSWENCENEMPYNHDWDNGTGYMNGLTTAKLDLPAGAMVRMRTSMPNNRRVLVIVTQMGNVVIFERYTGGGEDGDLVVQSTQTVENIIGNGLITNERELTRLTGGQWNKNIGEALEAFTHLANKREAVRAGA